MKHTPVAFKTTEMEGKKVLVRCYAPAHAMNSNTWKHKGGFITVTGGNGLGVVPKAFSTHKG